METKKRLINSKDRHQHATMVLAHARMAKNDRVVIMDIIDYSSIKKKKNPWELINWVVYVTIKYESGWKEELSFKSLEDAEEFLDELDNIERNKDMEGR